MNPTVLDPRGIRQTITRTPLSPRLVSLEGKTIYVVSQDRPFFTEEVARQLAAALPGSTVVYRRKPGWIRDTDQGALAGDLRQGRRPRLRHVHGRRQRHERGHLAERGREEGHPLCLPRRPALRARREDVGGDAGHAGPAGGVRRAGGRGGRRRRDGRRPVLRHRLPPDRVSHCPPHRRGEADRRHRHRAAAAHRHARAAYEEIQDYFAAHGWSDGLPIVPPTEERVAEMLAGTGHARRTRSSPRPCIPRN